MTTHDCVTIRVDVEESTVRVVNRTIRKQTAAIPGYDISVEDIFYLLITICCKTLQAISAESDFTRTWRIDNGALNARL